MKNDLPGKTLIDKKILEEHKRLKWWVLPFRIAVKIISFAVCAILVLRPGLEYLRIVLLPYMALIFASCYNVAHFYIHNSATNKRVNRIMGVFWSTIIFQNYSFVKYQHLYHHRYAGVEGDTLPHIYFPNIVIYLRALSGLFYWLGADVIYLARRKFPPYIKTEKQKQQVKEDNLIVLGWFLVAVLLTVLFPKVLLLIYWIPVAIAPGVFFIFATAEHYGLNMEGDPDIAYNTRSVKSNAIIRFVQWNNNYHAEHHFFPNIPLVNLHSLSKYTGDLYLNKEKSYIHCHFKIVKSIFNNNKGLGIISRKDHEPTDISATGLGIE